MNEVIIALRRKSVWWWRRRTIRFTITISDRSEAVDLMGALIRAASNSDPEGWRKFRTALKERNIIS